MTGINIQLNGAIYSLAEAVNLDQLLQQLNLSQKRIAIELNQAIVSRSQYSQTFLQLDDKIEIVTAIGGG